MVVEGEVGVRKTPRTWWRRAKRAVDGDVAIHRRQRRRADMREAESCMIVEVDGE